MIFTTTQQSSAYADHLNYILAIKVKAFPTWQCGGTTPNCICDILWWKSRCPSKSFYIVATVSLCTQGTTSKFSEVSTVTTIPKTWKNRWSELLNSSVLHNLSQCETWVANIWVHPYMKCCRLWSVLWPRAQSFVLPCAVVLSMIWTENLRHNRSGQGQQKPTLLL